MTPSLIAARAARRLVGFTLAVLLWVASPAVAQPPSTPSQLPPAASSGLWGKISQGTKKIFHRSPAPSGEQPGTSNPVTRATYNEPVRRPGGRPNGRRPAKPPRTISEYMAQERP